MKLCYNEKTIYGSGADLRETAAVGAAWDRQARRRINMKQLKWAILGTGDIANQMAGQLQAAGRPAFSVAGRNHEKAAAFAEKYGIFRVYDSIEEMFGDGEVQAVYIATPHNTHYEYIKKALESGKHVLAEKAITLNWGELEELKGLAEQKKCVLAEAMTIWHMPLYKKLNELLEKGQFGRVQMITANFGSVKEYDMTNRFFNMNLAGGALLDLGVYALSGIQNFMEIDPERLESRVKFAPTGADEQSVILLSNQAGQMATASLSLHSKQPKRIMISCEKAYIEIMEYPRADKALVVDAFTGEETVIEAGDIKQALVYEIEDMERAAVCGDVRLSRLQDTCRVMQAMTKLREDWGMRYPEETQL